MKSRWGAVLLGALIGLVVFLVATYFGGRSIRPVYTIPPGKVFCINSAVPVLPDDIPGFFS